MVLSVCFVSVQVDLVAGSAPLQYFHLHLRRDSQVYTETAARRLARKGDLLLANDTFIAAITLSLFQRPTRACLSRSVEFIHVNVVPPFLSNNNSDYILFVLLRYRTTVGLQFCLSS